MVLVGRSLTSCWWGGRGGHCPHGAGVNVEYVHPPLLLGQADLHLDLQPARPQQGIVYHVLPVGHTCPQKNFSLKQSINHLFLIENIRIVNVVDHIHFFLHCTGTWAFLNYSCYFLNINARNNRLVTTPLIYKNYRIH